MAVIELINFREKYPQYNDLDDKTLAERLASQYKQYSDLPQKVEADVSSKEGLPEVLPSKYDFVRGDKPNKLYTELAAPVLHGASTALFGLPKAGLDAAERLAGEDISRDNSLRKQVFPEQTTVPGKILRGASEAVGFGLGGPLKVGANVARKAAAAGIKLFPRLAKQTGTLAKVAAQSGRLAVEGGTAGLLLEPEHGQSREEQAKMFAAFGGAIPFAVQGVRGVGGLLLGTTKAIVKNVGGITDSTLSTIRRLGAEKVFDPAKAAADYISTNLVPRVRVKLNNAIQEFTPNIQKLLINKYGVSPEAVDTIKRLGVSRANSIRAKYNDSSDYFHRLIKEGLESKQAFADQAYSDAASSMKGESIYIDSTLRTIRRNLIKTGWMGPGEKTTTMYKQGIDPVLDTLTDLYFKLKPESGAKGAVIQKGQFGIIRDALGRFLKDRPSDRFVMSVRNALYKDAEKSGMEGLRAARDLERKAFQANSKYLSRDGTLKALGRETTLDRYFNLTKENQRQLRELEKYIGTPFVDELKAMNSARNLDKLSKFTDEQILMDLSSAKNPNKTKVMSNKYTELLGKSFQNEYNDLMAHFANSDFGFISQTPGASGGIFPSKAGLLRGAASETVKTYLRDVRPKFNKLGQTVRGASSKIKESLLNVRDNPISGLGRNTVKGAVIGAGIGAGLLSSSKSEAKSKYNIDTNFIIASENGDKGVIKEGYIPMKDGKPLDKSGITIGIGLDLGQTSTEELKKLGASNKLINQLKPYIGVKKDKALDLLKKSPLKISDNLAEEIKNISLAKKDMIVDEYSEYYNKKTGKNFSDFPGPVQTAIADLLIQYGPALDNKTPKFNRHILNGDYNAMYRELTNFGDKYKTRRLREAELIKPYTTN